MTHYVLIDGVLQKGNAATQDWARRAAKTVAKWDPNIEEAERDARIEALDEERATRRSDYEMIQDLEETE
jgi:hypothetical protein